MFKPQLKSKYNEDISILIKLDNHPWNYLCECGDASELGVKDIQNTNAIFISHTHIDHFVNFDAVIRHQIGIQRRVVICGPKNIQNHVQSKLKSYTWNLIQKRAITYEIREVVSEHQINVYEIETPLWELKNIGVIESNTIFEDKVFNVTAILLDHKTPTLAYKFKENDTIKIDIIASGFKGGKWVQELKTAFINKQPETEISLEGLTYKAKALFHLLHVQEGDTVGIIMDHAANTENHSKVKNHFLNCKTVFIESFYKAEDKDLAEMNYHSYSTQSGKIMQEAQVTNAIPVHFSRKYTEADIEILKEEFEAAFKII